MVGLPMLQFEFISNFRGYVFEADGSSANSLKPDSIQAEPRKFTHFHFPLDDRVNVRISVNAE